MQTEKTLKRPILCFVVLSNLIFLPLFLLVGITKILGLPSIIFDIMLAISSWSSTFAFQILFKRIYPKQNYIEYVKERFKASLNFPVIILAILIQVLSFIVTLFIMSSHRNGEGTFFTVSSFGMLLYLFFNNLFSGPLGEELGWRGFALNELQKKYTPLISALIVGFWWGMWHLPTWCVSGYAGLELIKYSLIFMIAIIATSIIITAFYNLNKNLLIPILIHQLNNFFLTLINGDLIALMTSYAILYSAAAVLLIMINPKKVLYGKMAK